MASKIDSQLFLGLLNIRSLNTGWEEFIETVRQNNFDILCLTETWLRADSNARSYNIPGYRLIHSPRGSRGGGVGLYLKSHLRARRLDHPTSRLEQIWVEVKLHKINILIGVTYRPESVSPTLAVDCLNDSLSLLSPQYKYLFLVGDININCLQPNGQIITPHHFDSLILSHNLHQIVDRPTRIKKNTTSLIDVVFTRSYTKPLFIDVIHNDDLSDHGLVLCRFPFKTPKLPQRSVSFRPLMDNAETINNAARFTPWELVLNYNSLNDMVLMFNYLLIDLINTFAPIRTRKFKRPLSPWMTDTLKEMRTLRDKACRKAKTHRTASTCQYYRDMRNVYNDALRNEKRAYFTSYVNSNKKNPSIMWRHINKILKPDTEHSLPEHCADAEKLNNHFINSVPAQSIGVTEFVKLQNRKFSDNIFNFEAVSQDMIERIIASSKSNALGSDGISMFMIKLTLPHSMPALLAIVNKSVTEGVFADAWKCSIITPIPKKTKIDSFEDLRPISILPALSKIIERVVLCQITPYLQKNGILPTLQSGFRKQHSTTTALLNITDDVLSAADTGLGTILVLLDFSRAFDCVNISLLLAKLEYYGFSPIACSWFKSYFSGRGQRVKSLGTDGVPVVSDELPVTRGVIQGSILGPTLFSIYTAQIVDAIEHSRYHLYADDTQIYVHTPLDLASVSAAVVNLNSDLDAIADWSRSHALVLNPKKSVFIIMGTPHQVRSIAGYAPAVRVGSDSVPREDCVRNLGLIMDENLRFERHVLSKIGVCFASLRTLYKLRPFLSEDIRLSLCNSLVLSHLQYCDVVYGPCLFQKTALRIQKVQNACMRFVYRIPRRSHITPILVKNKLLNMQNIRTLKYACFVQTLFKSRCPLYLFDKLKPKPTISRLRLRNLRFQLPKCSLAGTKGCFKHAASKIWNDLPPPVSSALYFSATTFRKRLLNYLLVKQAQEKGLSSSASNGAVGRR